MKNSLPVKKRELECFDQFTKANSLEREINDGFFEGEDISSSCFNPNAFEVGENTRIVNDDSDLKLPFASYTNDLINTKDKNADKSKVISREEPLSSDNCIPTLSKVEQSLLSMSDDWNERMKTSLKTRKPRCASAGGKWSKEEDEKLLRLVEQHGPKNWKMISRQLGNVRDKVQCLHRYNKVLKPGLQKGPWTEREDAVLMNAVYNYESIKRVKWSEVALHLHGRIGKQCRERWNNHVDPSIRKGKWTEEEDLLLFEAQSVFGNRWTEISKLLPGRTENNVKNRFHSASLKKCRPTLKASIQKGIVRNPDPVRVAHLFKLSHEIFSQQANECNWKSNNQFSLKRKASSLDGDKKKSCVTPLHQSNAYQSSFSDLASSSSALEVPLTLNTAFPTSSCGIKIYSPDSFGTHGSPSCCSGVISGMTPSEFLDWIDLDDKKVTNPESFKCQQGQSPFEVSVYNFKAI